MSTKIIKSILEQELQLFEGEIKDLWSVENKEHFYFQLSSDFELTLVNEDLKSDFCEWFNVVVVNLNQLKSYVSWKNEGFSYKLPYDAIKLEFVENLSVQVNKDQTDFEKSFDL